MKTFFLLAVLSALCAMAQNLSAATASKTISDFQDPADLKKWTGGDSGKVETSLGPRSPTDSNILMKVVFKGGDYPGIVLTDTPRDWSGHEALSFVVWAETPFGLNVRIDDSKSTNYQTRFNKVLKLEKGRNVCQLTVEEVARVLDVKDIRLFILFAGRPPEGLTMWLDDVVLGPRIMEQVPFIPYDQRKDLQPRMDVVTPHIPFAKPLAGGPLKAFILSGVTNGREVVELMQRLDLKVSLMTWDVAWDQNTWGMGDFYGQRGHAFDRELMRKYFTSSMQGPEKFDVLVLPTPIGWKEFPAEARAALVKRVKVNGEGLVLIHPFPGGTGAQPAAGGTGFQPVAGSTQPASEPWPEDLKELSPLINCVSDTINKDNGYLQQAKEGRVRGKKWKDAAKVDAAFMEGFRLVALEALPFEKMSYQKYELARDATPILWSEDGDPVLAVKAVGKGKVIAAAWIGSMITPSVDLGPGEGPTRPYRYQEVMYDLISRAMMHVAGRAVEQLPGPQPEDVSTEYPDPCIKASRRGNWWRLSFAPARTTDMGEIKVTAPPAVRRGERIAVEVAVPDRLAEGVSWEIRLSERCGGATRTLESVRVQPQDRKLKVELPTDRLRQPLALVTAVAKGPTGLTTDMRHIPAWIRSGQAEVVVTPPGDTWDDYEVFMWPVDGLPFLREFEDELIVQSGSTGVMDTGWNDRGRLLRWARAGLRILPHAVDGRPLHIRPYEFAAIVKNYNQTKDQKYLIRPWSFADGEFLKGLGERMTKAAELLRPFHIPAYVLCDEPSITSYREEFDFDFHPANVELFRKALKDKFKTIADLNAALNTKFESFEAIVPPTSEQARASGNWGLWNQWRAHNDTIMAEGYRLYRDTLRKVDPQARISISGTQTFNPFDGFDWVKLSPYFDAMNGYGYGEQERTRMSFYPGAMKNAKPAGYGNKGKGVAYQLWSSLAEHGCGHVLFWWVSFRNPDLTWCQSAMDYRKGFLELRGGIGRQYQLGRRYASPVAIQYSPNSMRAAWTMGKAGEQAAVLQAMTDAVVAAGFDPVFVSDEQIAAGELVKRGIKMLLLPTPLSLGRGQRPGGLDVVGGLLKFAQAGGVIIQDTRAQLDEFLQPANPPDLPAVTWISTPTTAPSQWLPAAMARAGVRPWVAVARPDGKLVPGLSVTVHKLDGDVPACLVTLLRKPIGQKEVIGADGVLTYQPDPSGGNEVESCVVDISNLRLPGAGAGWASCSAIRTGKPLEIKDGKIAVDMPSGDGLPLALLPYAVKSVELKAAVADRALVVSWQLVKADQGTGYKPVPPTGSRAVPLAAFAPHAVRIDVADESGKVDPALSCNATGSPAGGGQLTIPLAAEDAGRSLKLALKDILTGARAEAAVKVP